MRSIAVLCCWWQRHVRRPSVYVPCYRRCKGMCGRSGRQPERQLWLQLRPVHGSQWLTAVVSGALCNRPCCQPAAGGRTACRCLPLPGTQCMQVLRRVIRSIAGVLAGTSASSASRGACSIYAAASVSFHCTTIAPAPCTGAAVAAVALRPPPVTAGPQHLL